MFPSYTRSVGKTPLDENHIIELVSMSTYCHVLFRHAFPFPDILSEMSSQHHGFHSAAQQKENIKKKEGNQVFYVETSRTLSDNLQGWA